MTGPLFAQNIADFRVLEIEEGLNERVVNKVIRDKFGYFYLFQNQSIQRYDGSNFSHVNIDQIQDLKLSEIDEVYLDDGGKIIATIKNKSEAIAIESSKLLAQKLHFKEEPNEIKQSNYFEGKSIKFIHNLGIIYAAQGTFWLERKDQLINLGKEKIDHLHCLFVKQDLEGNFIAFFGESNRISELILVLTKEGNIENYSGVLAYSKNIKDVYTDRYDKTWAIASYNGLQILNFISPGLSQFFVKSDISKSQFGNVITSINTAGDRVLFTKESSGLFELLPNGTIVQHFKNKSEQFHLNQKMIFNPYSNNYVSYEYNYQGSSTINIFNKDLSQVKDIPIPFQIRNLLNNHASNVLICGFKGDFESKSAGLIYRYNISDGSLEKILDGIPSIYCITYVAEEKEYWIGTTAGIYICNQEFKIVSIIDTSKETDGNKSFPSDIITFLEKGSVLLAGSKGAGFSVIDKKSKVVLTQISKKDGLSNNTVVGIIEDNKQRLWVSTFNGLNVIDEKYKIIRKYYEYNGLPNREFNTDVCAKTKDGALLFGTINGFVKINPDSLLSSVNSAGLCLKNLRILTNALEETVEIQEEIIISKNKYDSLILEFAFPDYYIHRFDTPFDRLVYDSSSFPGETIRSNSIGFSKLPNKQYFTTFSFDNNTQFQYPVRLKISPNYSSYWYFALIALLVMAISFLIARLRYRFIRKNEENVIKRKNEIAELELTALRSQMNPHFIFNALGAIQYFIQTQDTDRADSYLSDFAMLIRHILEFSKSKFIKLSVEKKMLDLYVSLEKVRFEDKFDYEIKVDKGVDKSKFIPPMIIQPFVENAINHGLYNLKNRTGKLLIHFEYISSIEYVFHIIDNGIGREKAKKYRRKRHISRGLEIINSRVQTINDQNKIKLEIVTEDLFESNKARGTAVHIRLKYLTLDIIN